MMTPLRAVEAVHLGEQLVERLLPFFVAAHRRLDRGLAERVELVDEHDARRLDLRLREEIAHARRADADEHLDELRATQAEERDLGLAGDGPREQRLAGARRADEQHALGDPSADARVFLRVLQELDDFPQLVFGFIHARHIPEPHLHVVVGVDLRLAARERHDAAFGAAHAPEEEAPQPDEEDERDDPAEDFGNPAVGHFARVFDAALLEVFDQLGVLDRAPR